MLRNVFVNKIQCELTCPKSARKVSGLSRNARLVPFYWFSFKGLGLKGLGLNLFNEKVRSKAKLLQHFTQLEVMKDLLNSTAVGCK